MSDKDDPYHLGNILIQRSRRPSEIYCGAAAFEGWLYLSHLATGRGCGAAAFEALSCGRDRVRWPAPLAVF